MDDFVSDLENWMGCMPTNLRTTPIINLAIPGSHDSMSYGIKTGAPVAPDARPIVNSIYNFIPCVVRRWARTQGAGPTEQLTNGVRYFDLRISLQTHNNRFYFVHGLFCDEIHGPLGEIKRFLDTHPKEFVIFDFQHFYEFSDKDYAVLADKINEIFGDKIYGPSDGELKNVTLDNANGKQVRRKVLHKVIVIYRSDILIPQEFWPSHWWPTPWPDEINVSKLKSYLEWSLEQRQPDIGYVNQCVLTPPVNFIVRRFYSSLRQSCAVKVHQKLFDWIRDQTPGPFGGGGGFGGDASTRPTSNVFIADFVELNDYEFCKIVIGLNKKLQRNESTTPLYRKS